MAAAAPAVPETEAPVEEQGTIYEKLEKAGEWFVAMLQPPDNTPIPPMIHVDVDLFVLFGSAGGTAEEVAERVAREGTKKGMRAFVSSMNEFGVKDMMYQCVHGGDRKPTVIFVASTTGQGDPPINMKRFWKKLCQKHHSRSSLEMMFFGVIALGDSSYSQFNFVGKKLHRRLRQLGGNPIMPLCMADDQHDLGYLGEVNPWLKKLWTLELQRSSAEFICFGMSSPFDDMFGPESKFVESYYKDGDVPHLSLQKLNGDHAHGSTMEMRRVIANERVTAAKHWQDTRLITIDLKDSFLTYSPGDVLKVQPSNFPEDADKFFDIYPELLIAPPISLQKNPKLPWSRISPELVDILGPHPWSWTKLAIHYLDLHSVPRPYFFELMRHFATDPDEKEKLGEFCDPATQHYLLNYCNRPRRTIIEVLEDFKHTARLVPKIFLFDLIPAIKPRSFSIASSRKQFPNAVQILVAVVEYKTYIVEKRRGLCSNWLAFERPAGTMVPVWVEKGSFTFPPIDENCHVLMIGPGTGIAPFRSLIQEHPKAWTKFLFFGCRNEKLDFYFQKEWAELQEKKLLKFRCAFSRDAAGKKREYVTDKLVQDTYALTPYFTSKTRKLYIYVAGNSKQMPADVRKALLQVAKDAGIEDPPQCLESMEKRYGRYQTETWS